MFRSGSARSDCVKVLPPLSLSIIWAVCGVICISPRAPAEEVWSRKCDSR